MKISGLKSLRLATKLPSIYGAIFLASALVNSPSVHAQGAAEPADQEAEPDRSAKEPPATTPEGQPSAGKKKFDADKLELRAQKNKSNKGDTGGDQTDKAKADSGNQNQPDRERPKADSNRGKQPDANKEAETDKHNRPDPQRAKGGTEKGKAEADKAGVDAETKNDDDAAKTKLESDNNKAEAEKQLNAERAKAAAEKAKADSDNAKAEADTKNNDAANAKVRSEKAKVQADQQKELDDQKTKSDATKVKDGADKQKQLDAEKAKADEQKPVDADKAKTDVDKSKAEADRRGSAVKTDADVKPSTPDRDNAESDKQLQPPPSVAGEKLDDGQVRQRDGARVPARPEPANEAKAVEQLQQDRAKADDEFEKAKRQSVEPTAPGVALDAAAANQEQRRAGGDGKFEELRKQRRERVEDGGRRAIIEEPDKRLIIIEKDRAIVRHDETRRFGRSGKELKRERQNDGTTLSIFLSFDGSEIRTVEDEYGHVLRRSRRDRDGVEIVLIDNRRFYSSRPNRRYSNAYVELAPPVLQIPREKYVVEYEGASVDEVYDALIAPPVERLERGYAMEEVRESRWLRERMRRVDLNAINFAFASWEVEESEYRKLENVAEAIKRVLKKNRDEVFLIEGHTDAVGSDVDNLSLSDRRAEAVAIILSDTFRVPPENLTTQGYGEQYLKVQTEAPSLANRRVAVRRITPLLSRSDN